MASKYKLPDNSNDSLYVKKVMNNKDTYCGYRRDYLAQNLSEMEEGFIVCKKCTGIMRGAWVSSGDITCLVCSETPGQINPVKAVQSSIAKLEIKCPLLRYCSWKGQLSEAEEHLVECKLFLIECDKCNQIFPREEIGEHHRDLCPLREVECKFCAKKGKAKNLKEHFEVCDKYPIDCSNNCGERFPRMESSEHKSKCQLEEISCPYTEYGCEAEHMLRRDLLAHKKEYIVEHQDMSLTRIKLLEDENSHSKKKQAELQWEAKTMKKLDGVEWEIWKVNKLTNVQIIEGPKFFLNNYKLRIYCTVAFGREILCFNLKRIAGEFDGILGAAIISHYRVIIVNKQDFTKSYYEEGRMNYQLEIGVESDRIFPDVPTWKYKSYLTADQSLFLRFYFDVNTTEPLTSLTPNKYQKTEPNFTLEKKLSTKKDSFH